jgi:hypothetical protein
VEKNQPFRSKSQDAPVELSAPDTVGFAIPLDGVERLFLSRRPSRLTQF